MISFDRQLACRVALALLCAPVEAGMLKRSH